MLPQPEHRILPVSRSALFDPLPVLLGNSQVGKLAFLARPAGSVQFDRLATLQCPYGFYPGECRFIAKTPRCNHVKTRCAEECSSSSSPANVRRNCALQSSETSVRSKRRSYGVAGRATRRRLQRRSHGSVSPERPKSALWDREWNYQIRTSMAGLPRSHERDRPEVLKERRPVARVLGSDRRQLELPAGAIAERNSRSTANAGATRDR